MNDSRRDKRANGNGTKVHSCELTRSDNCSWGANLILFRFLFVIVVLLSINVIFFIPDWTHNWIVRFTFNTTPYDSSRCSLGDPYASNSCFEVKYF
jgi:hypothetical protein